MAGLETRLHALEARWEELSRQLSAPDAYEDLDRIQRLSQEQAKLREVVEVGRAWRLAQQAEDEAEEMAHTETDEELRALAVEEAAAQRTAEEEAFEKLRLLLVPTDRTDDRDLVVEI